MTCDELVKNYGGLLQHCDRSRDFEFDCLIKSGHLTWRPWIGADWLKAEKRILIVGESHYASKPDAKNLEERVKQWQCDVDGTREVVLEDGIGRWRWNPFLENLHRVFFGKDINGEERVVLWRHLAFCNFIQCPMDDCNKRPGACEFSSGWPKFLELLKLLSPDRVIFSGVSAAKCFADEMMKMGIDHRANRGICRNRARPWILSANVAGRMLDMIAIRHTSRYFSWQAWREYLVQTIPDDMAYLQRSASYLIQPSQISSN